jgi:hypothetical protein
MCAEELLEKQGRRADFTGGILDGNGRRIAVDLAMLGSCYGYLRQSDRLQGCEYKVVPLKKSSNILRESTSLVPIHTSRYVTFLSQWSRRAYHRRSSLQSRPRPAPVQFVGTFRSPHLELPFPYLYLAWPVSGGPWPPWRTKTLLDLGRCHRSGQVKDCRWRERTGEPELSWAKSLPWRVWRHSLHLIHVQAQDGRSFGVACRRAPVRSSDVLKLRERWR